MSKKIIDFEEKRIEKALKKLSKPKPIIKLIAEQMKSSNEKKRRED